MNTLSVISLIVATLALVFSVIAFSQRLRVFSRLARPVDRSTPKGNLKSGVLYAYTLGMAPWAKEGTRLHAIAYLRGVAFHAGVFMGLAILVASPWLGRVTGEFRFLLGWLIAIAAVMGLAGFAARFIERNLKSLSTPDDYFAVLVVTLFLAAESLWLFFPQTQALFYLISALMLVYAPLGKIRHCIYFAYSRLFYGKFVGSRGVLPHSQQGT